MKCLNYALQYKTKTSENSAYPVVIVAAGNASRMNGIDKMSVELCGVPVIARTVSAFDNCDRISEIVIVTRNDKTTEISEFSKVYSFKKKITVVEGGSCREASVLKGIKALGEVYRKVLIHDGARPLVSNEVISRVCDALESNDSVACAVKVKDTVKVVNEDMQTIKTLQRDFLVSVQTPQGVDVEKFNKSADKFDLARFTDDTSVVEAVGALTVIVEGDYKNIKITTPEDIKLAEAYL